MSSFDYKRNLVWIIFKGYFIIIYFNQWLAINTLFEKNEKMFRVSGENILNANYDKQAATGFTDITVVVLRDFNIAIFQYCATSLADYLKN